MVHFYTWNEFCNDWYPNNSCWHHLEIWAPLQSHWNLKSFAHLSTAQSPTSCWAKISSSGPALCISKWSTTVSCSSWATKKMLSRGCLDPSKVGTCFSMGCWQETERNFQETLVFTLHVFTNGFGIWQTWRYKTKRLPQPSCQGASSKFPNTKCFCRTFRINRRFSALTSVVAASMCCVKSQVRMECDSRHDFYDTKK